MEFIVIDLEPMESAKDLESCLNEKAEVGYVIWNAVSYDASSMLEVQCFKCSWALSESGNSFPHKLLHG